MAGAGRQRCSTLAQVADAGHTDYGSVGSVRGMHAARSAAGAATVRPRRGRRTRSVRRCDLAIARWTRLSVSRGGGQAVAGGVELAWRSPTAMLGWVEPLRRHGGASPVLFRPLMGELACIVFLDWVTYHMW